MAWCACLSVPAAPRQVIAMMPSCSPATTTRLLGLALLAAASSVEATARGAVGLDSLVFDKVVDGSKTVLVKFDKQYAYGDKEDAFKEFVKDVAASSLLVAEVGVQDYGDKENDDLRERFDVNADDFPVFLLFKEGAAADAAPVRFDGEVTGNGLKRFVTAQTGIWIGLAGTLEAFDNLAGDFGSGTADLVLTTKLMKAEYDKLEVGSDTEKTGKLYTIIIDRIAKKYAADGGTAVDVANEFVTAETKRVNKLLKGKLTDAKKAALDTRLNILASFGNKAGATATGKEDL